MRKIVFLCVVVLIIVETSTLSSNSCPTASRIDSCNPKCSDSSNCQGSKICCTNICGTKSCAEINQYQNSNKNDKYSGGSSGGYCGNTKCANGEKCEMDRTTKRMKCVRG